MDCGFKGGESAQSATKRFRRKRYCSATSYAQYLRCQAADCHHILRIYGMRKVHNCLTCYISRIFATFSNLVLLRSIPFIAPRAAGKIHGQRKNLIIRQIRESPNSNCLGCARPVRGRGRPHRRCRAARPWCRRRWGCRRPHAPHGPCVPDRPGTSPLPPRRQALPI